MSSWTPRGESYDRFGGDIIFSPDSSRVAYTVRRDNKWVAVVDGCEGADYARIYRPVSGPDGRHVAYLAEGEDSRVVVVDGVATGEYSRGYPYDGQVVFDGPGTVRFLAIRGDDILHVAVKIEESE